MGAVQTWQPPISFLSQVVDVILATPFRNSSLSKLDRQSKGLRRKIFSWYFEVGLERQLIHLGGGTLLPWACTLRTWLRLGWLVMQSWGKVCHVEADGEQGKDTPLCFGGFQNFCISETRKISKVGGATQKDGFLFYQIKTLKKQYITCY